MYETQSLKLYVEEKNYRKFLSLIEHINSLSYDEDRYERLNDYIRNKETANVYDLEVAKSKYHLFVKTLFQRPNNINETYVEAYIHGKLLIEQYLQYKDFVDFYELIFKDETK